MHKKIEELVGKSLSSIEVNKEKNEIIFLTTEGEKYLMYHEQECCESVFIEDLNGDLHDLVGSPILLAEVVTGEEDIAAVPKADEESFTWTFYKLATVHGYVTIRWYGKSNGHYSEKVSFERVT